MRIVLAAAALLLAGCSYSSPPPSPEQFALRVAAAERGSDLDRALFCGADPARVITAARAAPVPRFLPPAYGWDYHDLLVSRELLTANLRGSNAENPDCIALKSRPDLSGLWAPPPAASRSPNTRPRSNS